MPEILMLFVFGGFIFCLVGCIKGFVADSKSNTLKHELRLLRDKVQRLEQKIESDEGSPPVQKKTSEASMPPDETISPPTFTPAAPPAATPVSVVPPPEVVTVKQADHVAAKTVSEESPVLPPKLPPRVKEKKAVVPSAFDNWKAEWVSRFEGMNLETFIGTYILPRLGALGITIAMFIVLALVSKESGPEIRVILGYVASAALIGGAFYTEKQYKDYSRVLFSAGLAMAYFVTFATHYIPFAKIFDSPLPSLGGMAVIVGIWAGIAQKRRSQTVAMLVTLLGHFTIILTSFSVDNPNYYAGLGIVILSLGSAFFLLRNGWYYIAAVGMVLSYANHLALLSQVESSNTVREFTVGMAVLTVYLLIFALSEIYAPEKLRREKIPNWFRSIFVTVNTASFFALGSLLVNEHTFSHEYHHVFRYALAAVLLGIGVLYYLRRAHDPLYNTYFTKSIAMLTFGLAYQFSGTALTTWLAIEMVVLMVSAHRSGLVVTRVLTHGVALLTFVYGFYVFLVKMRFVSYGAEGYSALAIQAGFLAFAFWVMSLLYQRIDWSARMRLGLKVPDELQGMLWQLDLIPDPPEELKKLSKPLDGLLFPQLYALCGVVLATCYSLRLIETPDRFNLFAVLAAMLAVGGWVLGSRPYVLSSLVFVGLTVMNSLHILVDMPFPASNALGILALVLCALATDERIFPKRDSLMLFRMKFTPHFLYSSVLWGLVLYLSYWFDDSKYLASLLVLSVVWAGLSLVLHARALAFGAIVCFLGTHALWQIQVSSFEILSEGNGQGLDSLGQVVALSMIVVGVAGERFFVWQKIWDYAALSLILAFTTGWHFIYFEVNDEWRALVMAGMSLAFLLYAGWSKGKTAAVLSVLSVAIASLGHLREVYQDSTVVPLVPLLCGFLSCCVLWGVFERLLNRDTSSALEKYRGALLGGCIVALTILSLCMLERIPALSDFYLTLSWSVLGGVLFGLALGTQQTFYRYAGLSVLGLAICRVVFIDTSELEAMHRVVAFGGLGVILLLLGLGYAKAFMGASAGGIDSKQEVDVE